MRTQRYLPRIQNGRVAKRQTRSKDSPMSKSFVAPKSSTRRNSARISNRAESRRGESSVMWMMIFIGVALTAGFVFALRSQISAHQLGQAEERLREKLDEYSSQQKFLMLDQQRALSASESDRAGKQGGLDQLRLDQRLDQAGTLRNASVQKVVERTSTPVKPTQTGQQNSQNNNRLSKQQAKNNQIAKSPAKIAPLKANATKLGAAKAKAKKERVKQQQASRSQKRR